MMTTTVHADDDTFHEWNERDGPRFVLKDGPRDNACFYHAIRHQLQHHGAAPDSLSAREVHAYITAWVCDHWYETMVFPDTPGCTIVVGAAACDCSTPTEADRARYRRWHRPRGKTGLTLGEHAWGGLVEAYAAAQIFQRDIEQYTLHYLPRRRSRQRHRQLCPKQRLRPRNRSRALPALQLLFGNHHYRSIVFPNIDDDGDAHGTALRVRTRNDDVERCETARGKRAKRRKTQHGALSPRTTTMLQSMQNDDDAKTATATPLLPDEVTTSSRRQGDMLECAHLAAVLAASARESGGGHRAEADDAHAENTATVASC